MSFVSADGLSELRMLLNYPNSGTRGAKTVCLTTSDSMKQDLTLPWAARDEIFVQNMTFIYSVAVMY